jgi:hypothetical protein
MTRKRIWLEDTIQSFYGLKVADISRLFME